jgi:uncharacterized protein (DUF983 family)
MDGILDDDANPPCPVCGEPLGYYAELGDETECEHCGSQFKLDRVIEIHYTVTRVQRGRKEE